MRDRSMPTSLVIQRLDTSVAAAAVSTGVWTGSTDRVRPVFPHIT
jgi:hypothetical protein